MLSSGDDSTMLDLAPRGAVMDGSGPTRPSVRSREAPSCNANPEFYGSRFIVANTSRICHKTRRLKGASRQNRVAAPIISNHAFVGSGTAPESGSAEGSDELLPGPSEAPKLARHT
jgi:hypothetical protein